MKKPRGKQPTKPNLQKALIKRNLELKGSDKASLTVPVIYRKTFDWTFPNVTFVPINHRGFVVFRGDLDSEEYNRALYQKIELNIKDLTGYVENRSQKADESVLIELKEAILAASLKDRFVQINILKQDDTKLYGSLKQDMEKLAGELGFEYSIDHHGIQCTFKFPKHDIKYYAMESKICVQNALASLLYFRDLISERRSSCAEVGSNELLYNITRFEILMDRHFSDALNIIWDLPNISSPGYFLWINSCERILDEILYITKETTNAIKILKPGDLQNIGKDRDIFSFVWGRALEKCLEFCGTAVATMKLEYDYDCIQKAFSLLFDYEQHRETLGATQDKFIKLFSGDEQYMRDSNQASRLLSASYHLNNIFQASERIIAYSTAIAKNTLRIHLFNKPEK